MDFDNYFVGQKQIIIKNRSQIKLREIFSDEAKFMDWLANNCYNCAKLPDNLEEYNPECKLESIISYSAWDAKIDDRLAQLITENGKLCRCKIYRKQKLTMP